MSFEFLTYLILHTLARLGLKQARSQDVKFGGVKLFLEGQLSTQTENVNTNTKKTWYNVMQKYVKMVSKIIFFKKVLNLSV